MKAAIDIVKERFSCTCGEIYTSRKLIAPDCFLCNYDTEIEDMMKEYAQQVIDEITNHPSKYMCAANGDCAVIVWKSSVEDLKNQLK